MKAYQLISAHSSYDEGWIETVVNTYSSKEEAEKAKAWYDKLPEDPFELSKHESFIKEIEIQEVFTPWISCEVIARQQKEIDEYYAQEEAIARYEAECDAMIASYDE